MPKGKGKKKGGKGKGKGEKAKAPPPPTVSAEESLSELSKEFYLIQVKDLEERLGRYQAKCDRLQLSNDELQKQLEQQLEDQKQMITFLKRKNQQQTDQYLELEEKLVALRQAKETEKEHYEQQLSQLKEDSQRALDQAAVENKVLQGQLEALESFRINKEKMEAEMIELRESIEQQQREHSETLYGLEKKAVLDKDRMKKEMVSKVGSVAAEFRKVSDLQMAETTKRTIRENVAINQQLSKMSDNTMELIHENEALKNREKEMKRQVEILEANEKEMTRKNISNQKVLGLLKEKALEQEHQLAMVQGRALQCNQLEREREEATQQAAICSKEAESYGSQLALVCAELEVLKRQHADVKRELQRLRVTITRASHTIQASLQPLSSESEQLVQRESLLATLLHLLSIAPDSGVEESPGATSSQRGAAKFQYRPGDLGIVPPQPTATQTRKGHAHKGSPRIHTSEYRSTSGQLPPLTISSSPLTTRSQVT